jgi:hypothetical protein
MAAARMQTLLIAAALVLSCASRPVAAFSAQLLGLSTDGSARVLRCGRASPRQMQASMPALRMKKEDGEATQVRSPDLCVPAAAHVTPHTPRADDVLSDSQLPPPGPARVSGARPS